jgi:hypothetical protein
MPVLSMEQSNMNGGPNEIVHQDLPRFANSAHSLVMLKSYPLHPLTPPIQGRDSNGHPPYTACRGDAFRNVVDKKADARSTAMPLSMPSDVAGARRDASCDSSG